MAYSWTGTGQSSEIRTMAEIAKDMIERVQEVKDDDKEDGDTDEG